MESTATGAEVAAAAPRARATSTDAGGRVRACFQQSFARRGFRVSWLRTLWFFQPWTRRRASVRDQFAFAIALALVVPGVSGCGGSNGSDGPANLPNPYVLVLSRPCHSFLVPNPTVFDFCTYVPVFSPPNASITSVTNVARGTNSEVETESHARAPRNGRSQSPSLNARHVGTMSFGRESGRRGRDDDTRARNRGGRHRLRRTRPAPVRRRAPAALHDRSADGRRRLRHAGLALSGPDRGDLMSPGWSSIDRPIIGAAGRTKASRA